MFKFGDYLSHLTPNQSAHSEKNRQHDGVLALCLQQVNAEINHKITIIF